MRLTRTQQITLHADIEADVTLSRLPHAYGMPLIWGLPFVWNSDSPHVLMTAYNALAVPEFWVWKPSVSPQEYTGAAGVVWEEVEALPVGKARIFAWLTGGLTRNWIPADPIHRQAVLDVFAPGTETRVALLALACRRATRLEQLFARGAGTRAQPAVLVVEGPLSAADVDLVWGRREQAIEARIPAHGAVYA
jgi:hypothetical protein